MFDTMTVSKYYIGIVGGKVRHALWDSPTFPFTTLCGLMVDERNGRPAPAKLCQTCQKKLDRINAK